MPLIAGLSTQRAGHGVTPAFREVAARSAAASSAAPAGPHTFSSCPDLACRYWRVGVDRELPDCPDHTSYGREDEQGHHRHPGHRPGLQHHLLGGHHGRKRHYKIQAGMPHSLITVPKKPGLRRTAVLLSRCP